MDRWGVTEAQVVLRERSLYLHHPEKRRGRPLLWVQKVLGNLGIQDFGRHQTRHLIPCGRILFFSSQDPHLAHLLCLEVREFLTTLTINPCSWPLPFFAQKLQDLRAFLYLPESSSGFLVGGYLPLAFFFLQIYKCILFFFFNSIGV